MDCLVSTAWLAAELGSDDLVVIDATMHLPDSPRDARTEYEEGHVQGARFLDLASFIDGGSDVPKALPTAEQFAERMCALGVSPGSTVVLYDDSPVKSSARAWFVFTHYGFDDVALLDGGLAKWRSEGRPLECGSVDAPTSEFPVPSACRCVRTKAEMLANAVSRAEQVVDARDAARFAGEEGSGSEGHIPGSANVHFPRLFAEDGTWKDAGAIRAEFASEGIDLDGPVTASCNSGVTAAALLFGMHLAGKPDGALYDGSWLEWGSDPETPKEKGLRN